MSQHTPTMGETTLVNVSRTLACTPEVAFAWWTEPARIAQWWGPTGFSAPAEDRVIEPKIGGQIRSVMNVQEATAKAFCVDLDALADAQHAGDVLGAHAVLMDAYNTDVRAMVADIRSAMGLEPDPLAAYHRSGYYETVCVERAHAPQPA